MLSNTNLALGLLFVFYAYNIFLEPDTFIFFSADDWPPFFVLTILLSRMHHLPKCILLSISTSCELLSCI